MKRGHSKGYANASAPLAIDYAAQLLRSAPLATLALYYIGSIPYVLGLIFFLNDMTYNTLAWRRLFPASLLMAALFIWMRCWQSVFCSRLRAWMDRHQPSRWTPGMVLRLICAQTIFSPPGLFLLPLSFLLVLPCGWAAACYQNLCAQYSGESPVPSAVLRKATRHAGSQPRQNYFLLPFFFIITIVVFLNLLVAGIFLPFLFRILTGVETAFTTSLHAYLDPVFFVVIAGLTYLTVDPLVKTVYTMRCRQDDAVRDGRDLLAELQDMPRRKRGVRLASILVFLCCVAALPLRAEEEFISPVDLDLAIENVSLRPQFSWRLPRDIDSRMPENDGESAFTLFFEELSETISRIRDWMSDIMQRGNDWLRSLRPDTQPQGELVRAPRPFNWLALLRMLIITLAIGLLFITFHAVRAWLNRHKNTAADPARQPSITDIDNEAINAAEQPEEVWLSLASELHLKGDRRRALRAYFLAGLSFLGQRNIITIHRARSNRDYYRDLSLRTRRLPVIAGNYQEITSLLEWSWYGMHDPSDAEIVKFNNQWKDIRRAIES